MICPAMTTAVISNIGEPVLDEHGGIDHHPDRDEKDRPEKIFHGFNEVFDVFGLDGFPPGWTP